VTTSEFTNNRAVGTSPELGEGNGGAINNSSAATITNSTFNGNLTLGRNTNGGAISAGENELITTPPMAISGCTFTGNQAVGENGANNFTEPYGGQAGGGAIDSAAPLTITASTFTDNLAKGGDQGDNLGGFLPPGNGWVDTVYGGGVASFFSSLTVTNTIFLGNQAIGGNSAAGVGGGSVGGGIMSWGGSTSLTDVTLAGNQAIGGSGGPGYTGGSAFGGGFYNGISSTAAVSDSLFDGNLAQGGSGGSGGAGSVGVGGAIANGGGLGAMEIAALSLPPDTSTLSLAGSTLIFNVAQGGAGGAGGAGGNGLGGGCYMLGTNTGTSPAGTPITGATSASIDATLITANAALGGFAGWGGVSGQGLGGGLYIDSGAVVSLSTSSEVIFNFASTSHKNIFGVYTTS